jgi:hypothetical protein
MLSNWLVIRLVIWSFVGICEARFEVLYQNIYLNIIFSRNITFKIAL